MPRGSNARPAFRRSRSRSSRRRSIAGSASPSGGRWASNQSHEGVRVAQAIIDLALLTGQIGRPGTGANSITGQCNAMGSRLFSNTTNLLGGRDFRSASDRDDVANILGIPVERIPDRKSLAYDEIVEAAPRRANQGPLDRRDQLRSFMDRPIELSGRARAARLPRGPGHVRDDRDGEDRRPGSARGRLGGEGRHLHQL